MVNELDSTLQVYRFNGSSAPTPVGGTVTTGTNPYSIAWSPDGRFLAVVNEASSGGDTLQVFGCNFYYTGQAPQAFSTGLLFGNSVLGSGFDATVKIMGNARLGIKGKVTDDSA